MFKLDDVDRKILLILQKNARTKISEIAKEIHLSVTAVMRRIEKMEDEGIIQCYRTMIDGRKAGFEVHGFLIGGVSHKRLSEVDQYLEKIPEITRCETIISGGKELILEFYFKDLDALMQFYDSGIRQYLDSMTVYLVNGESRKNTELPLY